MIRALSPLLLAVAAGALSVTVSALPAGIPEEHGFSSDRLQRLDSTLNGYVDGDDLAGGVVLIARDGHILHQRAFGYRDREAGDTMQQDDLFRIASQTKAIVSTAVMMLQEQGALLITDPLYQYLPEFEHTTVAVPDEDGGYDVVPAQRPITIRDLLTHTAGIGYGNGVAADRWAEAGLQGWYMAGHDEPIRETVRRMASLPFDAHPGERWVYGYSTDILGALVEVVSGQALNTFLREHILQPLDMHDTRFFLHDEALRERLVTVYSARDGAAIQRAPDESRMQAQGEYASGPRTSFSGGAGLLSTARDYARFLQMLLNGGTLDGVRLLSPKSIQSMTENHAGDLAHFYPGNGFGLGFSIRNNPADAGVLGSEGEFSWLGAYHSIYWVDPVEDLLVVYLTQLIPAGNIDDFEKVRALIYQAMTDSRSDG